MMRPPLHGRRVLMAGGGPCFPELRAALVEAGCALRESALPLRCDEPCEDLVFGLHGADERRGEAVLGVFDLALALQKHRHAHDRLPRRAIAIVGEAGRRVAGTLATYLTAHTAHDDLRINVIVARGPSRAACDVTLALLSGLLDAARGQVFEVEA